MTVPAGLAFVGVVYTQRKGFQSLQSSWKHDARTRQKFWQKEQLSSALQDFVEAATLRMEKVERQLFHPEEAIEEDHKSSNAFIQASLQRLLFVSPRPLLTETLVLAACWRECSTGEPRPHQFNLFNEGLGVYTEHVRRVLLDEPAKEIKTPHPQSCAGTNFSHLEQIRQQVLNRQADS